jgi:hypothetical protein
MMTFSKLAVKDCAVKDGSIFVGIRRLATCPLPAGMEVSKIEIRAVHP